MHDEHRLKDRIELSLDNRQIFLLFVASAVVVTLIFALGVVVGKRMAPSVAAKAPTDPLALLDQLGKQAQDDDLTFPDKLSRGAGTAAGSGSASGSGAAAPDAGAAQPPAPASPPAAKPASRLAAKRAKSGKASGKAKANASAKASARKAKLAAAALAKRSKSAKKTRYRALPNKLPRRRVAAKAIARAAKAKAAGKAKGETGKPKSQVAPGTYTLQLSSFQDRSEAEQYMLKLRSQGLTPHMIPTRIAGRGIFYRVRLGSYTSWDAAMKAKQTYEKTRQVIAYVARN